MINLKNMSMNNQKRIINRIVQFLFLSFGYCCFKNYDDFLKGIVEAVFRNRFFILCHYLVRNNRHQHQK